MFSKGVSRLCIPTIAKHQYSPFRPIQARKFSSTGILQQAAAPVKRPVGAFRGGMFGFLFGSTLAGSAVYYYILEEYRVSNELLTEDIYALQAAVQRVESYTRSLDEQVGRMQKKST